jgi:hypothetical protein
LGSGAELLNESLSKDSKMTIRVREWFDGRFAFFLRAPTRILLTSITSFLLSIATVL